MAYPKTKILQNSTYSDATETDVDNPPIPDRRRKPSGSYDTLTPNYEQAWSPESLTRTSTIWSAGPYDLNPPEPSPQSQYDTLVPPPISRASKPWAAQHYDVEPPIEYEQMIAITNRIESARLGNYDHIVGVSSISVQPINPALSYYQQAKKLLWGTPIKRYITTAATISLIIGGIVGAYFGLRSTSSSTTPTAGSNTGNCTYPAGVNSTYLQLQETLNTGNNSLSIPGLDPATCNLISMVINNIVSALKIGGYNCWENVQQNLMALSGSALALNMDNITQIISALKQYCFPSNTTSSSTAMISSAPITSPANTLTTFTTTPTTSAPTTITTTLTTTTPGTTAITTSTSTPTTSTVTSTITSTASTTIQTTTPSTVTTSTGTTTTLAPSTTMTLTPGTTTVTTTAPTSSTTLFVSSTSSTTTRTSTTSTKTVTTTTFSTTSTTSTIPCCTYNTPVTIPCGQPAPCFCASLVSVGFGTSPCENRYVCKSSCTLPCCGVGVCPSPYPPVATCTCAISTPSPCATTRQGGVYYYSYKCQQC